MHTSSSFLRWFFAIAIGALCALFSWHMGEGSLPFTLNAVRMVAVGFIAGFCAWKPVQFVRALPKAITRVRFHRPKLAYTWSDVWAAVAQRWMYHRGSLVTLAWSLLFSIPSIVAFDSYQAFRSFTVSWDTYDVTHIATLNTFAGSFLLFLVCAAQELTGMVIWIGCHFVRNMFEEVFGFEEGSKVHIVIEKFRTWIMEQGETFFDYDRIVPCWPEESPIWLIMATLPLRLLLCLPAFVAIGLTALIALCWLILWAGSKMLRALAWFLMKSPWLLAYIGCIIVELFRLVHSRERVACGCYGVAAATFGIWLHGALLLTWGQTYSVLMPIAFAVAIIATKILHPAFVWFERYHWLQVISRKVIGAK